MSKQKEREHVIATEATLQAAFDAAVLRVVGILYTPDLYDITPATYRPLFYPLDSHALATYLTEVADTCSTANLTGSISAASRLDGQLRSLGRAAMLLADTWYPMLYGMHITRRRPAAPEIPQVAEKYNERLGIRLNFDDIFQVMYLLNLMATHHSREDGAGIEQGIYLDELERALNKYINLLAAIREDLHKPL